MLVCSMCVVDRPELKNVSDVDGANPGRRTADTEAKLNARGRVRLTCHKFTVLKNQDLAVCTHLKNRWSLHSDGWSLWSKSKYNEAAHTKRSMSIFIKISNPVKNELHCKCIV